MSTYSEMKEELARIRKLEQQNADAAENNRKRQEDIDIREANRAAEMDKAIKKQYRKGEKGEDVAIWDDAIRQAEHAISKEQTSVHDWRSSMIALLQMLAPMVKAMDASLSVQIRQPLKGALVDNLLLGVIYDRGLVGAVNGVKHLVSGDKPIELPALIHKVTFTDDNKLQVDKLVRADNPGEMATLDVLFKKGVVQWLEDNGYTPDPTDEDKYVDRQGHQLTQADFERLKNDPVDGFANYLEEEAPDLTFSPRP